jgi:carbamoyltransferase
MNFAGLKPKDVDVVACSYDPSLAVQPNGDLTAEEWEGLRTLYVSRLPQFLQSEFPGIERARIEYVPHHVAHAASAYLAVPWSECAVLVADGRGERSSYLAGHVREGRLKVLATQQLPHSLGLLYEELTMHLGFLRSSDEYKVMGLAAYGKPRFLDEMRRAVTVNDDGGFRVQPIDFSRFAPRRADDDEFVGAHADLAASVQTRLEEVLLELARWLHAQTGAKYLAMAGGVALNCVANARIAREGPYDEVWVQPAAGDAGTSFGAALFAAIKGGDRVYPMTTAALGREWSDQEIARRLDIAHVRYERPDDIATAVAEILAADGVVGWFQGRSEFGPRALGHRSLLANPRYPENLERLNNIKGREQFRPLAPMVLEDRAAEIFDGQLPSPYMLFTHRVRPEWHDAIAAAVHVDGTARVQTVSEHDEPLVARMLREFDRLTGTPVAINTSFNTAGRPMVDDPRDALECFGSAPVDALAIGPFLLRRTGVFAAAPVVRQARHDEISDAV